MLAEVNWEDRGQICGKSTSRNKSPDTIKIKSGPLRDSLTLLNQKITSDLAVKFITTFQLKLGRHAGNTLFFHSWPCYRKNRKEGKNGYSCFILRNRYDLYNIIFLSHMKFSGGLINMLSMDNTRLFINYFLFGSFRCLLPYDIKKQPASIFN